MEEKNLPLAVAALKGDGQKKTLRFLFQIQWAQPHFLLAQAAQSAPPTNWRSVFVDLRTCFDQNLSKTGAC
jgi:hypothetical protein